MRISLLCGGGGVPRGALALYENLPQHDLTFLVNTGDDFTHLGLEIWPDWDTIVYHLSGHQDATRGWGRFDEGERVMEELRRFSAPDWFHLGDRDIALHLYRTWALKEGVSRGEICRRVCEGFGIASRVLPVMEGGGPTRLLLPDGSVMEFQEWFVKHQGLPCVQQVLSENAQRAALTPGVEEALREADLLIFAPSNPYLSQGPKLENARLREHLSELTLPKIAVSPLVGGKAVKGPLDRLIESLSPHRGQQAIADYWAPYAHALLLPEDELLALEASPLRLLPCPTLLKSAEDRSDFCTQLVKLAECLL